MILHALLIGALVGVVVGSLGAGGGIVSVPILVYVLGQDPHQATGLSLIIVGLTAAVSLATRARSGSVAWPEGTIFAFAGLAGTWAGAALTGFLTGFFGVGGGFAIVPALHLALRYPMKRASATSLLVMVITAAFGLASRTLSGTLTIHRPGRGNGRAVHRCLDGGRVRGSAPDCARVESRPRLSLCCPPHHRGRINAGGHARVTGA